MDISAAETIKIMPDGIRQILAAHVSGTQGVQPKSDEVTFQVGHEPRGFGMSEHDVTVFRSATVSVRGKEDKDDVLSVLGQRTYSFNEDELKKVIADYVAKARNCSVEPASVDLKLTPRQPGDHGGWDGPSLSMAVVTLKLD